MVGQGYFRTAEEASNDSLHAIVTLTNEDVDGEAGQTTRTKERRSINH